MITQKDKFQIAVRDGFACQFCGDKPGMSQIEIDHLIPVSKRGSDEPENLITACKKCNRGKLDACIFPASMCESICTLDADWIVHKSFGGWQIKIHAEIGAVLELTKYGYWIGSDRIHETDWESHISAKAWGLPHTNEDLCLAISYFRRMIRK